MLVLGSGGETGGNFIDGAVAALEEATGWHPDSATLVIGTSIGGFRAGSLGPQSPSPASSVEALSNLAGPLPHVGFFDRTAQRLRVTGARLACRIIPKDRDRPAWRTPSPPHHGGAYVVSMDVDSRQRVAHPLEDEDNSADAISASAAVPFAYGPVEIAGSRHTDGAVWSPTHADLAGTLASPGAGTIVVVIAPQVPRERGRIIDRIHRRQLRAELATLNEGVRALVICPPPGPKEQTRTAAEGEAAVRSIVEAAQAFTPKT